MNLINLLKRFTRPGKKAHDPSNYALIQVLKRIKEKEDARRAIDNGTGTR